MLGINVRKRNSFSISACFMQFRNNIGSAGVGFGHGADYTKYLVTRILQYYDNIIQTVSGDAIIPRHIIPTGEVRQKLPAPGREFVAFARYRLLRCFG
jgi:hypothetical protein